MLVIAGVLALVVCICGAPVTCLCIRYWRVLRRGRRPLNRTALLPSEQHATFDSTTVALNRYSSATSTV